jgi:hypothetical protein
MLERSITPNTREAVKAFTSPVVSISPERPPFLMVKVLPYRASTIPPTLPEIGRAHV